jgi:signal transduction histidine kinase
MRLRCVDVCDHPRRHEPAEAATWPEATSVAIGLRLLALSMVTCAALFLPRHVVAREVWIPAIVAGAVLGAASPWLSRARRHFAPEIATVLQSALWAHLASLSGGLRSPLFAGLLLETALAGAWCGPRGAAVAALAGSAGSAVIAFRHRPADAWGLVIAVGFLALAWGVTTWTVTTLARQRRRIAESHAALRLRAQGLAEELRLLGDSLDPLVTIDDAGRVVGVNRSGLALLGRPADRILGEPWQAVLEPDRAGADVISAALADGRVARAAAVAVSAAGGRASRLADVWTGETPAGTRAFVLLRPPEASDGEDAVRHLGLAAAFVSHQIRNTLGSMQAYADDVERSAGAQGDPAEPARHFARALRSLGELCENVLALAGSRPPAPVELPLAETVASAVALAGAPAARVRVVPGPPDLTARAARGPLVHALFNLLDNACRETPPGGEVCVRVSGDRERAVVEISDRGPGLPAGWEKSDGPAPSRSGHGLGLLATRRFVEACGGRLEFERPAEGGTRARIVLAAGR